MAVDVPCTLCGDQHEDYLWEFGKDLDVFSDRILAGAWGRNYLGSQHGFRAFGKRGQKQVLEEGGDNVE
jgi:hypothetical protein